MFQMNLEIHAEAHDITINRNNMVCECGHGCQMGPAEQRKLVLLNILPFKCWHCERLLFRKFVFPVRVEGF